MRGVPYRGIVLFEDIDAAFVPNGPGDGSESDSEDEGRGRARENLGNGVTFSGLLNVLVRTLQSRGRVLRVCRVSCVVCRVSCVPCAVCRVSCVVWLICSSYG
jgi:hypothetical protein